MSIPGDVEQVDNSTSLEMSCKEIEISFKRFEIS